MAAAIATGRPTTLIRNGTSCSTTPPASPSTVMTMPASNNAAASAGQRNWRRTPDGARK